MVLFPLLIASSGLCQDNLDWPPCQTLCQSSNIYDCPQWQVTRREGGYLEEWDHLNIAFIFSVTRRRILLCLLSTCSCKVYPRLDHLNTHCQIILEIQFLILRKRWLQKYIVECVIIEPVWIPHQVQLIWMTNSILLWIYSTTVQVSIFPLNFDVICNTHTSLEASLGKLNSTSKWYTTYWWGNTTII